MKSKRALWLAFGACCVGFVVMSCSSSDSNEGGSPQDKGGENAGGDAGDKGGSSNSTSGKSGGGSDAQGGNGDEPTAGKTSTTDGGTPGAGGNGNVDPGVGGDASGLGGDGAGGAPIGVGGDGAGGDSGLTTVECTANTDCEKGQYCRKPACGDTTGICAAPSTGPVCGCNGITYYSGAMAAAAGISVSGNGQCTDGAVTCGLKKLCAKGQTCAGFAARGTCATAVTSVCWELPAICPKERASYENCESNTCGGLCSGLKASGHVATNALKCSNIKLP